MLGLGKSFSIYLNVIRPVGGGKYGFRFGSLRPVPTGTDSAKSLGSSSMDSRRLPMSSVSLFSVCSNVCIENMICFVF